MKSGFYFLDFTSDPSSTLVIICRRNVENYFYGPVNWRRSQTSLFFATIDLFSRGTRALLFYVVINPDVTRPRYGHKSTPLSVHSVLLLTRNVSSVHAQYIFRVFSFSRALIKPNACVCGPSLSWAHRTDTAGISSFRFVKRRLRPERATRQSTFLIPVLAISRKGSPCNEIHFVTGSQRSFSPFNRK